MDVNTLLHLSKKNYNRILSSNKINPTWCALKESHGHESNSHKLFMRSTGKSR